MITKLEVQNFQSHKKTELEFVPGVNVIIGASDSGKSSVLRAINWVISNRPLGDAFRSEWGGETQVILHTTEGDKITRARTNTKNEYALNDKILKAFGTEVPEEITEILQLDAHNIQAQMDAPFLLSDTPGEASRMLNKAASIDEIDRVVSGISSGLNKLNSDIKHKEKQAEGYREELVQYDGLEELEDQIEAMENLMDWYLGAVANNKILVQITQRIREIQEQLKETEVFLFPINDDIQNSEQIFHILQNEIIKKDWLLKLIQKMKSIQGELENTKETENAQSLLESAIQEKDKLHEAVQNHSSIQKITQRIKQVKKELEENKINIDNLEKQYHALMPETCPLCGKEV